MKHKRKSKIEDLTNKAGSKTKTQQHLESLEVLENVKELTKDVPVIRLTSKDNAMRRKLVNTVPKKKKMYYLENLKYYKVGVDYEAGLSKLEICIKYNLTSSNYLHALKRYRDKINPALELPKNDENLIAVLEGMKLGMTIKEISKSTGLSKSSVERLKSNAKAEGYI
ncbi:hypothetical protein HZP50_07120 [Elizabethkingia anophelis]|nr:hypothetical protein [Elizabethkingia anophelis]